MVAVKSSLAAAATPVQWQMFHSVLIPGLQLGEIGRL
ncbi:hypothetical protein Ae263Ps1_6378c [Pseudonocardia sp. Ae263_Ps1]|nr:hypothetical protein Ae263Ps1_6378c [Pseudonocardia sp. Ae263_Ps1]